MLIGRVLLWKITAPQAQEPARAIGGCGEGGMGVGSMMMVEMMIKTSEVLTVFGAVATVWIEVFFLFSPHHKM